jgi:hypothetical protein
VRDAIVSTLRPRRSVASFDSATALLMGLARALHERPFPHLGQSAVKAPLVRASMALPLSLRRRVYAFATGTEGVPPNRLGDVDLEQVAAWAVRQYPQRRFPAVLLGSSNGALTHLAAACGVQWLPQTMLVPVRRRGADPLDVRAALVFGARHAQALLQANPGVTLHQMHDANQDALSASEMAYFRVKWHTLPHAYQAFLTDRLEEGAPVIVACDGSSWPVSRVGHRHVFQLGALGGMSPQEYLATPGAPQVDDTAPESEWGFAEPLREDIRRWADGRGHPVVELRYDHPQDPAAGVADTVQAWMRQHGGDAERLLVSSFIVHDPWRTITTRSVPYWTFFPTVPAAEALAAYLDSHEFEEIDILLFSHGVVSQGLAEAARWEKLAGRARRHGRLLAVHRAAFPADFATFARYSDALRRLPRARPPGAPMSPGAALRGLGQSGRVTIRA